MAFTRCHWFNYNFVTDRAGATRIICDRETYYISAWLSVRVMWILTISIMSVTKIPLIRSDIILAGGSAVEVDLQSTGYLFPRELSVAFTLCFFYMYFVAFLTDASSLIGDDQAYIIDTRLIIGMCRIGAFTLLTISEEPLERNDFMFAC